MVKIIRFAGNAFLFLAGLVAGILMTILGTADHIVTAESKLDELNAIFLFPTWYYQVGVVVMAGLTFLLRKAARQLA